MFSIMVFLFFIVTVKSDLTGCNKPRVYMGGSLEVKCSDIKYGEKLLSKHLNFGEILTRIIFYKVKFKILPENVFLEFKSNHNLVEIIMKNCGIEEIENGAFKNLTKVTLLNFVDNNIIYLKVGLFDDTITIKKLFFNKNKIKVLENGLFDKLKLLDEVTFMNNHIKEIGDNIFMNNMNLKFIYLSYNNITYMSYETFKHLKINDIGLNDNPWICDCILINFIQFIIKNIQRNIPNCNNMNNPEHIRNLSWNNMTITSCKPTINITVQELIPELYDIYCIISPNDITTSEISLNNTNTTEELSTIYKISNVSSNFEENVTCSAYNQFGNITKSVNMASIYAGSKEQPINKIPVDKKVELECTRFMFKKVSVKWFFKNGVIQPQTDKYEQKYSELDGGSLSSLIIKDVTPLDQGLYKCTNENENEEQYFQLLLDSNEDTNNLNINLLLTIVLCVVLIFILIIITVCTVVYVKFLRKKSKKVEPTKRTENVYVTPGNDFMVESNVYCGYEDPIYEDVE